MKYKIAINQFSIKDEIPNYWTAEDYKNLLERFDFTDGDMNNIAEMRELLFLAITDKEPDEAAAIILDYKLSSKLSKGQITQLSHEMITDKVSEEYADISLHGILFHINQLLYKAFNGTFPNAKASIIDFDIEPVVLGKNVEINNETVLKAFGNGLSDRSLLKRLFEEQLNGEIVFPEAEHIIWELNHKQGTNYILITSEYWLNKEDFEAFEFVGTVVKAPELKEVE